MSSIFDKPKYKSHAELDREWNKLSREWKTWGLAEAKRHKERIEGLREALTIKREWEKECKKNGKECTCLPADKKTGHYITDEDCSHCKWRRSESYYNSPG